MMSSVGGYWLVGISMVVTPQLPKHGSQPRTLKNIKPHKKVLLLPVK